MLRAIHRKHPSLGATTKCCVIGIVIENHNITGSSFQSDAGWKIPGWNAVECLLIDSDQSFGL